ncbi:MAG: FKBP-type peptidyl-prolyl cis-trans isomerase [Bacteroidales bacterium]
MKIIYKYFVIVVIIFALISCSKNEGFTDTELGFSFKRCTKHDTAPKTKRGDIVFGQMKILLNNKKEIFSNYGSPERLFVIGKGGVGSIDEFLLTLHLGDSVVMIAPADSLTKYTGNMETSPGDKLYIYMTIMQIISSNELTGYQKEQQRRWLQEEEALTEYVLQHYERAEKKESGLFYLQTREGDGERVDYGKRIYVYYSVTDTSGKLYDTNIKEIAKKHGVFQPEKKYSSFDFILGDDALIAGWTEGLSYMKEGGRAVLIIPSNLAYGDTGFGLIPPYTPLIFDISIAKVDNVD